ARVPARGPDARGVRAGVGVGGPSVPDLGLRHGRRGDLGCDRADPPVARREAGGMTVPDDPSLRSILGSAKTIAVVGLSSTPERYSFEVASYLQRHGYRIVPVNPNETEVLGERAYPSLLAIPRDIAIDAVDVFRRSEETPDVARDAVAIGAKVLWLQDDIVNE